MKSFKTLILCAFLSLTSHAFAIQDAISHWPLNGNGFDAKFARNGTILEDTSFASGRTGDGAVFDGVNSLIEIPGTAFLNWGAPDFSVSFWMKPDPESVDARLVSSRGAGAGGATPGWQLKMKRSGSVWYIDTTTLDDGQGTFYSYNAVGKPYAYSRWHHVVMVYRTSESLTIFVNGEKDGYIETPNLGALTNNKPMYLGGRGLINGDIDPVQLYKGMMDEVRLYQRALTQKDVAELYTLDQEGGCDFLMDNIQADTTLEVPGDYADINAALDCLSLRRIARDATVTIQVADGTYSLDETIEIDHVDGARIQIVGNASNESAVTFNVAANTLALAVRDGHSLGLFDGFTMIGDLGKTASGFLADRGGQLRLGGNVTMENMDIGVHARRQGHVHAADVVVRDSGSFGFLAEFNASINADSAESDGGDSIGLAAFYNSSIEAPEVVVRDHVTALSVAANCSANVREARFENSFLNHIKLIDTSNVFAADATYINPNSGPIQNAETNTNAYLSTQN